MNSVFLCADQRQYVSEGYGSLIPGFLSDLPGLFRRREIPIDVACINCSLPDEDGYCSYNISADLAQPAVETARVVIAQVNRSIPYLYGTAMIHESKITAAVECDAPPVDMQFGPPTEIEAAIGKYIAAEIPDGATLQIGVGGMPNAVLNGLKDHKHLGLHTEAMTDGVFRLMQMGVIDNSLKKVEPGRSVACLALGSRQMYEYLDHNKDAIFYDVSWTNDPAKIRQNPNAVAINSAIEVDLTGQVTSCMAPLSPRAEKRSSRCLLAPARGTVKSWLAWLLGLASLLHASRRSTWSLNMAACTFATRTWLSERRP